MEEWLSQAIEANAAGQLGRALDIIYDAIDDKLLAGKFDEVDASLRLVDVRVLDTAMLIGILTITSWARSRLPFRNEFFELVRQELDRRGENDPRNLQGLEGK